MIRIFIGKQLIRYQSSLSNVDQFNSEKIKIPNKIYRDELSLLKSLAKCTQITTGFIPHYHFNDPSLISAGIGSPKNLLLSKASGKLTAKLTFNEIKHAFINVAKDEPKIKCLLPLLSPIDINKKVKVGELTIEKGLNLIINLLKPKEAYQFYVDNKTTTFSQSTMERLLELLSATGGSDYQVDPVIEQSYCTNDPLMLWALDNEAEMIFQFLPTKTKHAYEVLIRGSSKFQYNDRAIELFEEFINQFPNEFIDLKTCNALLRSFRYCIKSNDEVMEYILKIFNGMSTHKITPNVYTFNNTIFAFSERQNSFFIQKLYQEMIALNISPILGTYALLVECYSFKNDSFPLFKDIITILENRLRTIDYEDVHSEDDFNLFSNLMLVFRNYEYINLATRLMKITLNGGRIHLFNSEKIKTKYFDNFIRLLLNTSEDIPLIFNIVKAVIPTYVTLSVSSISQLNRLINKHHFFPLYTDLMQVIEWGYRKNIESEILPKLLKSMLLIDTSKQKNCDIISNIMLRLFETSRGRRVSVLDIPRNVILMLELLNKINDKDLLWEFLEYFSERQMILPEMVEPFIRQYYQLEEYDKMLRLVKLLANGMPSDIIVTYVDKASLTNLLTYCNEKLIPILEKCCDNTSGFLMDLEQCRNILNKPNVATINDSSNDYTENS